MTPQQLGRRIRKLRKEKGLSQEDLAQPDYTAAYISHIEHGNRRPSQEALAHMANRMGLTLEQLISGRDPNEDLRLEVEIQEALALVHSGTPDEAVERLRPVISRADELGHARAGLRGREALGSALYRQGLMQEALAQFDAAAEVATEFGLDEETPSVVGKARCLFQLGGGREAIHVLERHLTQLRAASLSDPSSLVATLAALIPPYFEAGMVERAKEAASEGWRLAEAASDLNDRACLYVNRAQLLLMQKDARGALASLSLAEDVYRQLEWQIDLVKVNLARALTLTDEGDLDPAEEILKTVLEDADSLSATDRGQALSHIARVHRLKGNFPEAVQAARAAVRSAPRSQPMILGEAHRELGLCLKEQSDLDGALKEWKKGLAAFELAEHHEEVARTARLIAEHLVESGNVEASLDYFRKGMSSVEEIH